MNNHMVINKKVSKVMLKQAPKITIQTLSNKNHNNQYKDSNPKRE